MAQQFAGLVLVAARFELDDLDVERGSAARNSRAIASVCANAITLLRVPIFKVCPDTGILEMRSKLNGVRALRDRP